MLMTQVPKKQVHLPLAYSPRSYQARFLAAMVGKTAAFKRAVLVWHRRAGKDKTVLNFTILKMLERVGIYYYFFPTYAQGKKILWDGIDRSGFPFMKHFPEELIVGKPNETEMQITLQNGSIFQIIGTDKMDSIVGTNPVGCVFSEYALQNPKAWDLTRPILKENQGWAVFVYTPRGKNHGFHLWRRVSDSVNKSRWYVDLLTVDQTLRDAPGEDGSPVLTPQDIEEERAEGMSEQLIQQEYYCDWEGAIEGAFYIDQLALARKQDRICDVPWNPAYLVDTAWDLGMDDATAIGFTQTIGNRLNWIDYLEDSGKGLEHYVKLLREKPYAYGQHFGPHDIKVREWGSGKTRLQTAASLGINLWPVPKLRIEDGVQAVRRIFPKSYFDLHRCERLVDALASYHREWDEKLQAWKAQPVHDWASNPADMTRYRAIAFQELPQGKEEVKALTAFSPYGDTYRERAEEYDRHFNPVGGDDGR